MRSGDPRALALFVALPLLVAALCWWPRASPVVELPALALPAAEVRTALDDEDALASTAPDSDEETARRSAYLEQGLAELSGGELPGVGRARLERLALATTRLLDTGGEDAIRAARAADVLRMERALLDEGDPEARAGELGRFPLTLERWHAVESGERIAPRIVVRALAAARWNALHFSSDSRPSSRSPDVPERLLTDGMSPLHLRAYYGWLALHGAIGLSPMRVQALHSYADAGGSFAREAHGALLYLEGERELAAAELRDSYAETGNLRVRNAALAALDAP
jgi:hypothetical protein